MRFIVFAVLLIFIPFYFNGQNVNNWNDYISFYRKTGSPFVGGNCQMTPSCSKYADLQFSSQPFILAFTNTADRLMRCSHDINNYKIIGSVNEYKLIDFPTDSLNKLNTPKWQEGNYATANTFETNETIEFQDYLINRQFYNEALIEINRYISSNKDKTPITVYVNYFRCLRSLGNYERIETDFKTILSEYNQKQGILKLELAKSWIALNNYSKSLLILKEITESKSENIDIVDEARILASVVYSKNFELEKAKSSIAFIDKKSKYFANAESNLEKINKAFTFKQKKPWIAGTLSIIPGLGYLYAKHPMTAFSALLANSLISYAAYTSFQSGNTGIGILTSMVGLGFYFGNINGAKNSVVRYNTETQDKLTKNINLHFSQ